MAFAAFGQLTWPTWDGAWILSRRVPEPLVTAPAIRAAPPLAIPNTPSPTIAKVPSPPAARPIMYQASRPPPKHAPPGDEEDPLRVSVAD